MHRRPNLEDFPRPGVPVDLASSPGTDEATLRVLVQDREDPAGRVLPGRFLRERHTVREVFGHKVVAVEVTPQRLLRPFVVVAPLVSWVLFVVI